MPKLPPYPPTSRQDVHQLVTSFTTGIAHHIDTDAITDELWIKDPHGNDHQYVGPTIGLFLQHVQDNILDTPALVTAATVLTAILDHNDHVDVNDTTWLRIDGRPAYRTYITSTNDYIVDLIDYGNPTPTVIITKDEGGPWGEDPAHTTLLESDETMTALAKLTDLLA